MKVENKEINVGDFLYVGTEKVKVIEILSSGQPIIKWDTGVINRNLPFSWLTLKPSKVKLLTESQIKLLEQELQTLKLKIKKLKKESKEWEQKYRDERESHFESMADGDL